MLQNLHTFVYCFSFKKRKENTVHVCKQLYHISSLRREMFKKSLTKYRLISKCFREGCFNTIKSIDAYTSILHA